MTIFSLLRFKFLCDFRLISYLLILQNIYTRVCQIENLKCVLSRNLFKHKRYTMTSFFYVVSHCHLSATLQTISITVVNLKDNRAAWFEFL